MAPCRRVRLVVVTPSASILGDPDIHVKEGSEVRPCSVLYRIVLYCTPYCTGEALYCTVHAHCTVHLIVQVKLECLVTNTTEPVPFVTWLLDNQVSPTQPREEGRLRVI